MLDTSTLVDRVYRTLRQRILNGDFAVGQKLNLSLLAKELNVSNTPIREAVSKLEKVGLVEIVPYVGPKVRRMEATEAGELFDIRILLEGFAVSLAATRATPEALAEIERVVKSLEKACHEGDVVAATEADRAFHEAVVRASGNRVLLELLPILSDKLQLIMELNAPKRRHLSPDSEMLRVHQRIYRALKSRDEEMAVAESRRALLLGKRRLLRRMSRDKHDGANCG